MYTLRNKYGKYLQTGTNFCTASKPEVFFDTLDEALQVWNNPPPYVDATERHIVKVTYTEEVVEIPVPTRTVNIRLEFPENVWSDDLAECVLDAVEGARQDKNTTSLDIVVR